MDSVSKIDFSASRRSIFAFPKLSDFLFFTSPRNIPHFPFPSIPCSRPWSSVGRHEPIWDPRPSFSPILDIFSLIAPLVALRVSFSGLLYFPWGFLIALSRSSTAFTHLHSPAPPTRACTLHFPLSRLLPRRFFPLPFSFLWPRNAGCHFPAYLPSRRSSSEPPRPTFLPYPIPPSTSFCRGALIYIYI